LERKKNDEKMVVFLSKIAGLSLHDVQAAGEAFSPEKRTSSTFFYFSGSLIPIVFPGSNNSTKKEGEKIFVHFL
jgi:hypothetical protein